jgi:hypothetical protein
MPSSSSTRGAPSSFYTPLPDIRLEEAAKTAAMLRASIPLAQSYIMRRPLEPPHPKLFPLSVIVAELLRLKPVLISQHASKIF